MRGNSSLFCWGFFLSLLAFFKHFFSFYRNVTKAIYIYINICVCMCVYVCVYININIYTHTHTLRIPQKKKAASVVSEIAPSQKRQERKYI